MSDEPLSAGRVEYLEQARERVRNRRIRRTALIVVALTLVVLFTTGIVGSSVAMAKDWADTARILLFPGTGWPQQTGVMEVKQLASMNSSFVELGEEGCVVWSRTGTRLNSIQSGYARPALAAGKNRFVLYNRSGNELRVESRTQNLYTKTMESSTHPLCHGRQRHTGRRHRGPRQRGPASGLLVLNGAAAELEPYHHRRHPAAAGFFAGWAAAGSGGGDGERRPDGHEFLCRHPGAGRPRAGGQRQRCGPVAELDRFPEHSAAGDSRTVLYNVSGGERAAYDFTGQTLRDISVDASGNTALLLASGQLCQAVMLGRDLGVESTTQVQASNRIVRSGAQFYLLTDTGVECLSTDGTSQWTQSLSARPQGLLADRRQLLVFCGNTVQGLTPPAAENNATK